VAGFVGHHAGMTTHEQQQERADLLETMRKHRGFLRYTAKGLTDEQAARCTTVSALCIGGIIKHVTTTEEHWTDFIVHGPRQAGPPTADDIQGHVDSFRMLEGETLAALLERYDEVSRRTDELVRTLPSLDASQPLPEAPWFPPDTRWSARRVLLHIIAETGQHAGHADIIREALDGQKTMG
jgi:hypothetical protein